MVYTVCTLILWLINEMCNNFSGNFMLAFQKVGGGGGGGARPLGPPVPTPMESICICICNNV